MRGLYSTLYEHESGTIGENDKKNIEAFEMWCYRRILKIMWINKVSNTEALVGRYGKLQ